MKNVLATLSAFFLLAFFLLIALIAISIDFSGGGSVGQGGSLYLSQKAKYAAHVASAKVYHEEQAKENLFDPFTAKFEWREKQGEHVLYINSKNLYGAYTGFKNSYRTIESFTMWSLKD